MPVSPDELEVSSHFSQKGHKGSTSYKQFNNNNVHIMIILSSLQSKLRDHHCIAHYWPDDQYQTCSTLLVVQLCVHFASSK